MPKLAAFLCTCPNCLQRSLSLKPRVKAYFGGTICQNCGSKLKLSRAPAIFMSIIFAFIQLPVVFLLWALLAAVLPQMTALLTAIAICIAITEGLVLLTARFKPA